MRYSHSHNHKYPLSGMEVRRSYLAVTAVCVCALLSGGGVRADLRCGTGISTPGTTLPKGDIALLYGSPLRIACLLDPAAEGDSSKLRFYRGADLVDPASVTVLNETAAELYVERPAMSNVVYYCKLLTEERPDGVAVCLNRVIVGGLPTKVEDFDCLSLNWENLTCSWTPPQNYLDTKYSLMYIMPGRSGRASFFGCPEGEPVRGQDGKLRCFWDLSTNPHYRQAHPEFKFNLTASNAFGSLSQVFKINHYARVKPNRAIGLAVDGRGPNSATVRWKEPFPLNTLPPGIVSKLMFKSEYDEEDRWREATPVPDGHGSKGHTWHCALELPHAYAWYDVRIYMKSAAVEDDSLWSDFASVTFRSEGKKPDRPPDVRRGAFEIVSSSLRDRDVILYWKQLEPREKNDANLTYAIRLRVNGTEVPLDPAETVKGHVSLPRLPLRRLDFSIASKNSHGESEEVALLSVPDRDDLVPEPVSFTKIEFGDGVYELSWKPPERSRIEIEEYALFWCDNARDRPYQCDGRLEWEVVPASLNIRNVTVADDRIYQFAISATGGDSDSGIVWASCTVIPNKIVGKMKNIWINRVGATYVEVGWKLECSDRIGVVDGYRISYCPIVSPRNRDCKEPEKNVTIARDPSAIHSNVTDLKPYTTYAIRIAVITRHGDGLLSDTLYNTTLEGPPSPPRDIRVSDVGDSRLRVSWNEPLHENGLLRYYQVNYYSGSDERIRTVRVEKDVGYREVTLAELSGYTNYTVTVEACTVACSTTSEPIVVRTAIGHPGTIMKPTLRFPNGSRLAHLSWNPPHAPGGAVDLYQVRVIEMNADGQNFTSDYNTTDRELSIPGTVCNTDGNVIYYYSVRAINFDASENYGAAAFLRSEDVTLPKRPEGVRENAVLFPGPWSMTTDSPCSPRIESNAIIYTIIPIFIVMAVVGFFAIKYTCSKCKDMQNIKVSLPPGLDVAPSSRSEKDPNYLSNNLYGPTKHSKDREKTSLAPSSDEISLLPNKTHGNGTKQGKDLCGFSDTDSTTISLTSHRNSGDECKDARELHDDVNSDSSTSSLRLRNVNSGIRSASASTEKISHSPKRDSSEDVAVSNYSAVGVDFPPDFRKYDIAPPTVDSLGPPRTSSGYVTVDNIPRIVSKEPTSAIQSEYVKASLNPELSPENLTPSKNTGYVSIDHPMLAVRPTSINPQPQTSADKGYVKCDDPRFGSALSPMIDFNKKSPNVIKRISAPPLLTEKSPSNDFDSSSPLEKTTPSYSRFGWDK